MFVTMDYRFTREAAVVHTSTQMVESVTVAVRTLQEEYR